MAHKKVAIVGATGYTGAELVRLLSGHPLAKITTVTSGRQAGLPISASCPWLASDLVLSSFDPETLDADVVFLCQENGFAREVALTLVHRGIKVVDLSADYRLTDPEIHQRIYRFEMPVRNQDVPILYGLCEWADLDLYQTAAIVANPGCYPTASLLALLPLVQADLVSGTPVIDAKSGVSGAGRSKAETDYLFSELTGGFKAYAGVGHRHTPEIEQLAGIPVRFTPHLIPAARGIHATLHVPLAAGIKKEDLREVYSACYRGRKSVRLVSEWPSTKHVLGSNRCDIHVDWDERTGFAVIASVIDNLVKGASGQAIQNMNLLMGWDESLGLPLDGVWP